MEFIFGLLGIGLILGGLAAFIELALDLELDTVDLAPISH